MLSGVASAVPSPGRHNSLIFFPHRESMADAEMTRNLHTFFSVVVCCGSVFIGQDGGINDSCSNYIIHNLFYPVKSSLCLLLADTQCAEIFTVTSPLRCAWSRAHGLHDSLAHRATRVRRRHAAGAMTESAAERGRRRLFLSRRRHGAPS